MKIPAHLSPEAQAMFVDLTSEFELDIHSIWVLTVALESWDRMKAAQKIIAAEGLSFVDRFGQKKMRPEVLIERDSRASFERGIRSLGLSLEPLRDAPGRPLGGK